MSVPIFAERGTQKLEIFDHIYIYIYIYIYRERERARAREKLIMLENPT